MKEDKIISEAKKYYKDDINCYDAFLYGVEFAEDNQWISVKDDLPYNHRELIHNNYTTKYVLALDNGYPNVTHWMPIPKLEIHDDKH